jgi:hypothetical protein
MKYAHHWNNNVKSLRHVQPILSPSSLLDCYDICYFHQLHWQVCHFMCTSCYNLQKCISHSKFTNFIATYMRILYYCKSWLLWWLAVVTKDIFFTYVMIHTMCVCCLVEVYPVLHKWLRYEWSIHNLIYGVYFPYYRPYGLRHGPSSNALYLRQQYMCIRSLRST